MSILQQGRYWLRTIGNMHRRGAKPDIFLFATPRGGSTWVMELIASQPGLKYYDEPFNVRRDNVRKAGVFRDWDSLMPEGCDPNRVFRYLADLQANRYRYMNPAPLRKHHRFFTDRIVFKLHELEHLVGEIAGHCNGQILYLLRHPIPTTLSRAVYPRLDAFLRSRHYRERLEPAQRAEIERICRSGDKLLQGMVSWCYENLLPLKHADTRGWTFITYEELLLNPGPSCRLLQQRLQLDDLDTLLRAVGEPASNIGMSDRSTREILRGKDEQRRRLGLVTKWTGKLSAEREHEAMQVLEVFGLEAYQAGRLVASDAYLHFDDTATKVRDFAALRSAAA
jgi:hypothetical protein